MSTGSPENLASSARASFQVPSRPTHARGQGLCLLGLLVLAGYMVWLGAVSTYVGLTYGLSANLRDQLYTNMASAVERESLRQWRMQILPFWNAWLPHDDLAQIELAEAVEAGLRNPESRKRLPVVLQHEAAALQRNPGNAYAWARLAYARFIYNGASRLVAEPLVMSMQVAPYEPPLLPSRVVLALQIEKYWTPELENLFPQQLALAWDNQRLETVRAAYQDGIEDRLRDKLSNDTEKLAQYNKIITELLPKP